MQFTLDLSQVLNALIAFMVTGGVAALFRLHRAVSAMSKDLEYLSTMLSDLKASQLTTQNVLTLIHEEVERSVERATERISRDKKGQ